MERPLGSKKKCTIRRARRSDPSLLRAADVTGREVSENRRHVFVWRFFYECDYAACRIDHADAEHSMNIAVWNLPPADLIASGFSSGKLGDQFEVQRLRIADCERVLLEGQVDAALLPTLSVLMHHENVDVVPAVALSTWKYPFARLAIEHDLGAKMRIVAYNPDFEQERFLSEVILREHYRMEPTFMACNNAGIDELLDADADARLLVGADVPMMSLDVPMLDLGQEWFELVAYPMTWGLFAFRKGELDAADIRAIRDAVLASERQKQVWLRAQETSEPLYAFYAEELRFRLDDLCLAGLSEIRQFLFFYEVADDVRDIPFIFLPDEDSEENEGRRPII